MVKGLSESLKHSTSEAHRTISRGQSLLAAGDPLSFQQIEAMNQPVEPITGTQVLGDAAEALAEAELLGFSYNPDSLEDISYEPDDIRTFLQGGGSAAEHGEFFHNGYGG